MAYGYYAGGGGPIPFAGGLFVMMVFILSPIHAIIIFGGILMFILLITYEPSEIKDIKKPKPSPSFSTMHSDKKVKKPVVKKEPETDIWGQRLDDPYRVTGDDVKEMLWLFLGGLR